MRKFNIYFLGLLSSLLLLTGCEYDGIDPITKVDPGADAGAPQITVNYPQEGTAVKVVEPVTSIDIKFGVTDDIEVDNIVVSVDGDQIATINEFTDYRIIKKTVTYDNLTTGDHTLTIEATDTAGNTTTQTVNFSKEPPYSPRFANEYFYMPFDGDYTELVTITPADQVGEPGFTEDAFLGTKAYLGAEDSYITIPFDGSIGNEFTAAFWYKVSSDPDKAGILVAGADENRTQGFRLFREAPDASKPNEQLIKLNVGTKNGESWNDGGIIDASAGDWVYIAFTVSETGTKLYFNGSLVNESTMDQAIDWTGVEKLTIGSGGETFSYWGHESDSSPMDELRLFDAALTQEQIQGLIDASAETLYMPFEDKYKDLISDRDVTVVGNPGFTSDAADGDAAYQGAADSYLTLPADGLQTKEFSATFWYKFNSSPDRAGILTISPEDADHPNAQNIRTSGFRLFREIANDKPTIKLNVGTGEGESWNNGGAIDAYEGQWVHVAFTISSANNETVVYINGEPVNTANLGGKSVDWTGADLLSIMSGAPRFTEWGHKSDQSAMDNLKFYNKALTPQEVKDDMSAN